MIHMVCRGIAATMMVAFVATGTLAAEQKSANVMAGEQRGKSADAPKAKGEGQPMKKLKDADATKAFKEGEKQEKSAPKKLDSKDAAAEIIKR